MDFRLLGSKCRIEYGNNCSTLTNNRPNLSKKKLMIARIPENVNENDLHNLFVNCHLLKYCPARTVYSATTTMKMNDKAKIIWGYEHFTL